MSNPLLLAPIFIPLGAAALGLLFAHQRRVQHGLALLGGGLAWLCSVLVLAANVQSGIQIYRVGGWPTPFGIVLTADMLSALFQVMATSVMGMGIVYAVGCKEKSVSYPAFMPLFLCMGAGLSGALYTGDLFTLFVFVELMVISSVALVALSDNRYGLEAAIKYLLISAMGTLFLLIGIGSVYATYGTLTLADIARLLASGERPLLAPAAAIMLTCAFLLKSAVFPFHFWQPDFHTTAPAPVHSVLSSVVVKVGVYGLMRLTTLLFLAEAPALRQALIVLGLIGIFFGSLSALRTYDAKRLLAYSTFGQIGFILVCIGWGTPLALTAAIVYAFNHAFIKSALLMLTGVVSSHTVTKTARLAEIGGVGREMRLTGVLYFVGGMALAGVPPLNGFISKVALVQGGISAAGWVALGLAVAAGAITLLYMMRTWQHIFQQPYTEMVDLKPKGDRVFAPAVLIAACVALGLYAAPLLDLAGRATAQLGDPSVYIRAVLGGG